ncbi:MAG: hypothetical protein A2X11_16850 [Bacteroidetes bacterium GWE2_42_24]|nr:MAG: hypothetical protein A2X11_16850 [Bacteroidetes bacterium GWE2_42_24]PKP16932.1 MAG: hypothetical protein CVU06_13770 [Bacteroidetes bacterium HGW-Bacteroidetes-22]
MKPAIYILSVIFICLTVTLSNAQSAPGTLVIKQDARIDTLLVRHIENNKANPTTEGWRVQVYFESGNNSKQLATNARDRFIELFPEQGAYLTFNEPYYKVRVGDFRTRMDAEGFRQMVITEFPNAYVVPDKVMYDKLK